ncbi:short integuments 2, mitochondrial-like [Phalaenopsis equestris]|uniref:short integuments 2, mitochondrial-like n=1 Tax=Phalaenopsis equestris TaxID=78828 RepID=UPI0009E2AA38|nr:short integuments 2, mitochondrial-like [Phalaenopsis equestris]
MGRLSSLGKRVGDMSFVAGGGVINWFPGHMAAATRAIRDRLKLTDLVIEVRDARIPLSSTNEDLQNLLSRKRRIVALNKKDLANPNIIHATGMKKGRACGLGAKRMTYETERSRAAMDGPSSLQS